MADQAATMKWWGWGDPARETHLPDAPLDRLRAALGAEARRAEPVALEDVVLGEPRLSGKLVERLGSLLGADWVRQDRLSRWRFDIMIAATALVNGLPLIHNNPQDFEPLRGLIERMPERFPGVGPLNLISVKRLAA